MATLGQLDPITLIVVVVVCHLVCVNDHWNPDYPSALIQKEANAARGGASALGKGGSTVTSSSLDIPFTPGKTAELYAR